MRVVVLRIKELIHIIVMAGLCPGHLRFGLVGQHPSRYVDARIKSGQDELVALCTI